MEKVTGIARDRLLPTFASGAFLEVVPRADDDRAAAAARSVERGPVALFPTCLVEYQQPAIGKAAVAVLERNGFSCELPEGQVCCGMPWLDAGDADKFREAAQRNVDALLPAVEAGRSIVVPQPTCAYTLKEEYPAFLGTDARRKVAAATFDAAEFLMNAHKTEKLDTEFDGRTYESIVWHSACHYRAQQIGPRSSQLMQLTGAQGADDRAMQRDRRHVGPARREPELARRVAKPLMEKIRESDAQLVAGDCQLANVAIEEGSGKRPVHPLQVLARAYGRRGGRMRKLTVDDIVDMRAYERERDELRRHIIDLKKLRRIALGPIMTIVFENTLTMRWQVQEMARVERMLRDEQIAHEVETYNQLIPDAGELSATLMIELTSEPALREWLPRLVGIQRTHRDRPARRPQRVRRAVGRGRAAAHARRHHRGRALPQVPVHARATSRCSRAARCTSSSNHPEYDQDVLLAPEQHAELLVRPPRDLHGR